MARRPITTEIEVFPEADALGGFPHPRLTPLLHGHAQAEEALAAAVASGRMHHGWLITGPEGVGKATLAWRLAVHVLAEASERDPFGKSLAVEPETTAARQVRALSHPGLLLIRRPYDPKDKRFKSAITVEEVRRLRSFLSHSAADAGWRVVLIDSADEMNVNAANAVLKSLEEPPARTVFLLVSSEPGRLLPTIRSRCRTLALLPLDDAALQRAVVQALGAAEKETPTPDEWPTLIRLAHGSVRRCLTLVGGDGLALNEAATRILGLLPKVDWAAVHTLGDDLSGHANDQRFETFFALFTDGLHRLVKAAATGAGDPTDVATARRLMPPERVPEWAALWPQILTLKADADLLNLDRKALLIDIVGRMAALAR